jgi:hypothetical protein
MGRPRAAKAFRDDCEKTAWWGWIVDRAEKPLFAANASRSSAWSPIATATRGEVEDVVEMMPKGIFASEKCDPFGILNQERSEAIV